MLDHAGKVRKLDGSEGDAAKIEAWRAGVTALAKLPQVRVKLSMLGFLVPGWTDDAAKEERDRERQRRDDGKLVQEMKVPPPGVPCPSPLLTLTPSTNPNPNPAN